jgi:Carboxypeptidase regulatory-like domain/TonB-dependent Receptor Plug Domain
MSRRQVLQRTLARIAIFTAVVVLGATTGWGQELGGAGTVQGTVKDPTGGVMAAVTVELSNPVTGLRRSTTTDTAGRFVFRNLPPNPYHVSIVAQGFAPFTRDVDVRTAVPIELEVPLALAGATATVDVVGHADLLERDPTSHTDIDQSLIAKLPTMSAATGLNQVITLASPGIVSDSNGFFHPIGDHAQTQFSIDNQPVTDQQSRVYSNQISPDAVQSMEVITGVAPAEYGDKSSLVVHIVTRSGLDQPKPTGTVTGTFGSFSSPAFETNVGGGSHTVGNFLSLNTMKTDRFLDPPEFEALHDHGSSTSFFDRLDAHAGATSTFHLNVQAAQSSFDVPNTFDQNDLGQDQHQKIKTFNVAPGYSQVLGGSTLFTANAFVRQDHLTYTPSPDPFSDQPGSVSQGRKLTNYGFKADLAHTVGAHNLKFGGTVGATKLDENFTIGLTDPEFNAPDSPDFNPDLLPFDLTRGGSPLRYAQKKTINQQAAYVQDDIKVGNADFKLGVRLDHYDGLTTKTLVQPRLGVSYAVPGSNTVLRASYGRTLETPYNENLLLSSGLGLNGVFGDAQFLQPGERNQGEFGVQQAFGNWVVADFGYFIKRTDNAYDFGVLFDTPIVFPISWDHSKIDGFTGKVNLIEHGGFSAFVVMGHTSAIFSPPGNGGILLEEATGDFRIDHDQKFNSTTNVQYTFNKRLGAWGALNWRYDSGLVAGAVGSVEDALALTGDQQAAIGFFCGGTVATRDQPITDCASGGGATRLRIPAEGTEDDVNNPPRIAPRHLFDLMLGADNVFHTDKAKVRVRFSVVNLTNKQALYNFLSTFTGTHFVTPRAYQVQVGVGF